MFTPLEVYIGTRNDSQELIPVEQQTIMFRGKPLIVVRLPDGRPGVVLRWICENLGLAPVGQVARIKRTEVIADDLVYVQVQTEGGFQTMPTLVLDSAPYWLATIDTKRVKDPEQRLEILHYQKEAVAALFTWASSQKAVAAPTNIIPSEPIVEPTRPGPDASPDEWLEYHRQMVIMLEWRRDVEQWRGNVDKRLESLETVTSIILDRMGPQRITPEHQGRVRNYVQQLAKATGKSSGTIYSNLYAAFNVPRYQEIPEEEWSKVVNWFRVQIERGTSGQKRLQEQITPSLFDESTENEQG